MIPLPHRPLNADRRCRNGRASDSPRLWRLTDPKIALASLVPFGVGAAPVWRETHRLDPATLAAFVAISLVEVGKNAVNNLYDFRSGADMAVRPDERTPYSGGKRVLIDHDGRKTTRDGI